MSGNHANTVGNVEQIKIIDMNGCRKYFLFKTLLILNYMYVPKVILIFYKIHSFI